MNSENTQEILKLYKEHILGMVSAPVNCESCGTYVPTRANALNTNNVSYVFNGQTGSPGHPALPYLQCPIGDHGEHWCCHPHCWLLVAIDCLLNHQFEILNDFHNQFYPEQTNDKDINAFIEEANALLQKYAFLEKE